MKAAFFNALATAQAIEGLEAQRLPERAKAYPEGIRTPELPVQGDHAAGNRHARRAEAAAARVRRRTARQLSARL